MKQFLIFSAILFASLGLSAADIPMTFRNGSLKSIPLLIPGVMNPNLSPMGNSGVDLKIGQEVLFRYKGKKRVLLTVTADLEGKTLRIDKLLEERKKEIDEELRKKKRD